MYGLVFERLVVVVVVVAIEWLLMKRIADLQSRISAKTRSMLQQKVSMFWPGSLSNMLI